MRQCLNWLHQSNFILADNNMRRDIPGQLAEIYFKKSGTTQLKIPSARANDGRRTWL